ncbi:MAG: sugar ABC transporter substrate-binding protein [Anaerolineae bacterium]|nr:sugar ABC transporter substrate-binding protein [Anaerolineae bacterium]
MKRFFVFVSLLLMVSLLGSMAAPVARAAGTEIVFYQRGYVKGGDVSSVNTDKAIELFQQKFPNYSVKVVGIPWTDEGTAKLEAALTANADINVFRVTSLDLGRYVKAGVLSPIDDYLTDEDKKDFFDSGFGVVTYDGKKWAWPLWVTAISIMANTDYFKERGVDIPTLDKPWTWDQFVEAAKKLTFKKADGTQVYGFTSAGKLGTRGYDPLFYIDGGRMVSPDGMKFVQNEAKGASALQKIADLAQVHKVTPPDFGLSDQLTVRAQFKDNKTVAMLMEPPGFIPDLEKAKFPFTIVPVPVGELGKPVTTGAFGLYAVVDTKDPEKLKAAHELAKWLTGSEVGKQVEGYQLAPGLRRSNVAYATSPERAVIAKMVEFGIYEIPLAIPAELQANYTAALQSAILGQKTAKQALDDIAPEYQKVLDDLHKAK